MAHGHQPIELIDRGRFSKSYKTQAGFGRNYVQMWAQRREQEEAQRGALGEGGEAPEICFPFSFTTIWLNFLLKIIDARGCAAD